MHYTMYVTTLLIGVLYCSTNHCICILTYFWIVFMLVVVLLLYGVLNLPLRCTPSFFSISRVSIRTLLAALWPAWPWPHSFRGAGGACVSAFFCQVPSDSFDLFYLVDMDHWATADVSSNSNSRSTTVATGCRAETALCGKTTPPVSTLPSSRPSPPAR